MTSLPVPARAPWFKRRAMLVSVPGFSDEYHERICFTRSVTAMGHSVWLEVGPGIYRVGPRDPSPFLAPRRSVSAGYCAGLGDVASIVPSQGRISCPPNDRR